MMMLAQAILKQALVLTLIILQAGHCLPSQTSEKMFICPESEGYFPYDDTCGPKFWDCWRWHANLQECSGGRVFDPETTYCTSYEAASCNPVNTKPSEFPITTTTTTHRTVGTDPTLPPILFICPEENGYFPYDDSCGPLFWDCLIWHANLMWCTGGRVYDPVTELCVPYDQASCNPANQPSTATQSTTSTTSLPFNCPEDDGNFPVTTGSCGADYFMCIGGTAYAQTCPGETIFDPTELHCMQPESSSCNNK